MHVSLCLSLYLSICPQEMYVPSKERMGKWNMGMEAGSLAGHEMNNTAFKNPHEILPASVSRACPYC